MTTSPLRVLSLLATGLLFAGCSPGDAPIETGGSDIVTGENMRDFGAYELHFNALSTDTLAPNVAKAYGIVRSKNRALLNVTILGKPAGASAAPVTGTVRVQARNLTGQLKNLTMREITEGEGADRAVYYIGEVPVADGETLIFKIEAIPSGETEAYNIEFKQQFFAS